MNAAPARRNAPPLTLGAHISTAKGYAAAVHCASEATCDCLQVFTVPPRIWAVDIDDRGRVCRRKTRPIDPLDVAAFQAALQAHSITAPIAHASYLINLASPDPAIRKRSLESLLIELQRAGQLGIPYVIVHPGSHTTSTPRQGLWRIVQAINVLHRRSDPRQDAMLLLENTAGQGTNLGWNCEQLAAIADRIHAPERLGFCLDTCHAFAAGAELRTAKGFDAWTAEVERWLHFDRVRALHLNDSQREIGSRVDRHAHIGRGEIGEAGFRRLLQDSRWNRIPMYLETPKDDGDASDMMNLRTLRRLAS